MKVLAKGTLLAHFLIVDQFDTRLLARSPPLLLLTAEHTAGAENILPNLRAQGSEKCAPFQTSG